MRPQTLFSLGRQTHPRLRSNSEHDRLVEIARRLQPFLSPEGEAFVSFFYGDGGRQVLPVRSALFRDWLLDTYLQERDAAPREIHVRAALRTIESAAHYNPEFRTQVFRRVAAYGDRTGPTIANPTRIVLDLVNTPGEVIDVTPEGWRIAPGEPHCFLRGRHMRELPRPSAEGCPAPPIHPLRPLRSLLNFATESDWIRLLLWLVAALRGVGPFPILVLFGPPGCGKTTAAHLIRQLIDPTTTPFADHRAPERDLYDHASRNWVVALDNVSHLSARLASFINRMSSGASFHLRHSYDPHEPAAIHLQRPVILAANSRAREPLSEPSLERRTLVVSLVKPACDRPLFALWSQFERCRPQILAALCDALSLALRRFPQINPEGIPRLADPTAWAVAAAPALGVASTRIVAALDPDYRFLDLSHPLVRAVAAFMASRDSWTGSASELLQLLPPAAVPKTPKGLSQKLNNLDPALIASGLRRTVNGRKADARSMTIERFKPWAENPLQTIS